MNPSRFEERSAGNLHAAFCGSRRRVIASGDPVTGAAAPSDPIAGATQKAGEKTGKLVHDLTEIALRDADLMPASWSHFETDSRMGRAP